MGKNTNDIKSVLRFEKYNISSMKFGINEEFQSQNEDISLDFGFEADVSISSQKDKAKTKLTCTVFDVNFKEKTAPFYLEISIVGYFSTNAEMGNIEDFRIHSMAILLPYLRAIITSFTSQTGISPVIIPPINVFNLFGKKNGNE